MGVTFQMLKEDFSAIYSRLFCPTVFKSKPYKGYEFYFTVEFCLSVCFCVLISNHPVRSLLFDFIVYSLYLDFFGYLKNLLG